MRSHLQAHLSNCEDTEPNIFLDATCRTIHLSFPFVVHREGSESAAFHLGCRQVLPGEDCDT